jgi:hypothetical protein
LGAADVVVADGWGELRVAGKQNSRLFMGSRLSAQRRHHVPSSTRMLDLTEAAQLSHLPHED